MARLDIVIATRNPGKFRELAALFRVPGVRFRSLAEFPSVPEVRESGRTFRANAVTKARTIARATTCWAIADDSGLEVDALGGAPGVRSARFAGERKDDAANNAKLLRALAGLPATRRGARFRCVLALASPAKLLGVTDGSLAGRIMDAPRGRGGFGYDPLFLLPRLGKTTAEISPALKNRLSHRGRAARKMHRLLARLATSAPATAAASAAR